MAARPLNKDYKPFQSSQDFKQKMEAMVSPDQATRLGQGWMHWAEKQMKDWEAMVPKPDQAKADEADAVARLERHFAVCSKD